MRMRQHERLEQRLREAAAAGDVLAMSRLQERLAARMLEAVARATEAQPLRIDLSGSAVPPRCRTKRRALRTVVIGAGRVPATAVFPPAHYRKSGAPDEP